MKTEITLTRKYRGYEVIVRKVSYEPEEIKKLKLPHDYYYWYCGYVVLPKDHPYYEVDYDEVMEKGDIRVHGGLTFSGRFNDFDGYLLGFDCNHVDDNPSNQNENYTLNECLELVDQLIEVEEMDTQKIEWGFILYDNGDGYVGEVYDNEDTKIKTTSDMERVLMTEEFFTVAYEDGTKIRIRSNFVRAYHKAV